MRALRWMAAGLALAVLSSGGVGFAAAAADLAQRISFAPGGSGTVVLDSVPAGGVDHFVLSARQGQTLILGVNSDQGQLTLAVTGANGRVLLYRSAGASGYRGLLPATQDYYVDVFGLPGAAASYSLDVSVPSETLPVPRRIQFPAGSDSTTVSSSLPAAGTDHWVLFARGGQTLSLNATSPAGTPAVIVYGADGNVLQSDHAGSPSFNFVLPSTQDYLVDVRGLPDRAISYSLYVSVPATTEPVAQRITFAPGTDSVTVTGQSLPAFGLQRWVLRAMQGQVMIATLVPSTGQPALVVFGADGVVLQSDHAGSPRYSGTLPSSQDYFLDVRGLPDQAITYTLQVTVLPLH